MSVVKKIAPKLALYHYQSCPFCRVTRNAINSLGLNIEQRDIQRQPKYRTGLIRQGGKAQVPCLRIEDQKGHVSWMYESAQIIVWLRNNQQRAA